MWGALGGLCALLGAATARGVVARADAWNLWQLASPAAPPHASTRQIAVRLAPTHTHIGLGGCHMWVLSFTQFHFWSSNGEALAIWHVVGACM